MRTDVRPIWQQYAGSRSSGRPDTGVSIAWLSELEGLMRSRLDLTDVRDDGNDPLRPLIARACAWIEQARSEGGSILVHCVS